MNENWYDHAKPKNRDSAKLCYTDTVSCIVNGKSKNVYAELAGNLEKNLIHQTRKLIDLYP